MPISGLAFLYVKPKLQLDSKSDGQNHMTDAAVKRTGAKPSLQRTIEDRFGAPIEPVDVAGTEALARMAARRVHRRYFDRPVEDALLRALCACALSAPTKSDLQQADIVIVRDRQKRAVIEGLLPEMPWISQAPVFLVFCANGARLPGIAAMRGKPFPNDHLDAFFNATVDAALVLATFVHAADAVGLGSCPISVIRDHAAQVSELLGLPDRVVPVAGLTVGWPAAAAHMSPRLPLAVTVHENTYDSGAFAREVDAYDRRRAGIHSYKQRDVARWGEASFYGWSEDKARQYAVPQRADFGAFVRGKGFCLD